MLTEGHLFLPFAALCCFDAYLAMWAHFGPTLARSEALAWRQTLASNLEFMREQMGASFK